MRLFFITILFSNCIFSQQNYIIVDSSTKERVSYATIVYPRNNKGFYSNDKGEFQLFKTLNDSIYISALGYYAYKTDIFSLKDTVFLNKKTVVLDEIRINNKFSKEKEIGFKAKKHYWYGARDFELGVIIKPTDKIKDFLIHKIMFPVKNHIPNSRKEYKEFNSVIKIRIFSVKNDLPYKNILKKPILINYSQNSNEEIEIDLSDEDIRFTSQGVFISIILLGEIDRDKNIIINDKVPLPGIICTNKKTRDFSYIKAFYRHKFSADWNFYTYDKLMMKKPIYPAFKLVIKKHEN